MVWDDLIGKYNTMTVRTTEGEPDIAPGNQKKKVSAKL